MWVVKLGGSLQTSSQLSKWLDILVEYGSGKVIIVPGGGRFADQVRHMQSYWEFDDGVAHEMALLCMEQYAYILQGMESRLQPVLSKDAILNCLDNQQVPVWLPHKMIINRREIPASWRITSDSLALWLAGYLGAGSLLLIKTTQLPDHYLPIAQMPARGLVDDCFPDLMMEMGLPVFWLSRDDYPKLEFALRNGKIPARLRLAALDKPEKALTQG